MSKVVDFADVRARKDAEGLVAAVAQRVEKFSGAADPKGKKKLCDDIAAILQDKPLVLTSKERALKDAILVALERLGDDADPYAIAKLTAEIFEDNRKSPR